MFLDSDDYLVGNCIETMLDKIIEEKADIVQAGHYSFVDGNILSRNEVKLKSRIYSDTRDIVCNPGYPWAKIYKSGAIIDNYQLIIILGFLFYYRLNTLYNCFFRIAKIVTNIGYELLIM